MQLLKSATVVTAAILFSFAGPMAHAQSGSVLDLVGAGEFKDSQNGRGLEM